jgi:hypothetical protein
MRAPASFRDDIPAAHASAIGSTKNGTRCTSCSTKSDASGGWPVDHRRDDPAQPSRREEREHDRPGRRADHVRLHERGEREERARESVDVTFSRASFERDRREQHRRRVRPPGGAVEREHPDRSDQRGERSGGEATLFRRTHDDPRERTEPGRHARDPREDDARKHREERRPEGRIEDEIPSGWLAVLVRALRRIDEQWIARADAIGLEEDVAFDAVDRPYAERRDDPGERREERDADDDRGDAEEDPPHREADLSEMRKRQRATGTGRKRPGWSGFSVHLGGAGCLLPLPCFEVRSRWRDARP